MVTLAKEEGEMGIQDFRTMYNAMKVRDVAKIWEEGGSTWSKWMNCRYIKGKAMDDIRS